MAARALAANAPDVRCVVARWQFRHLEPRVSLQQLGASILPVETGFILFPLVESSRTSVVTTARFKPRLVLSCNFLYFVRATPQRPAAAVRAGPSTSDALLFGTLVTY